MLVLRIALMGSSGVSVHAGRWALGSLAGGWSAIAGYGLFDVDATTVQMVLS
mgnify:CR=1 FL=1